MSSQSLRAIGFVFVMALATLVAPVEGFSAPGQFSAAAKYLDSTRSDAGIPASIPGYDSCSFGGTCERDFLIGLFGESPTGKAQQIYDAVVEKKGLVAALVRDSIGASREQQDKNMWRVVHIQQEIELLLRRVEEEFTFPDVRVRGCVADWDTCCRNTR
ncbi:MAG: hypothetical protein RL518_2728 [Pseudomonadota bacterium]